MATLMTVDPVAAATYFVGTLGCTAFPVYGSRAGVCLCGDPHDGTGRGGNGPDNIGKHPATPKGFKDATDDVALIRTFLSNPGTPNYGLNAPEGVMAIDVDGVEGLSRWEELQRAYGPLPVTLTTITANGRHYFFRWPEAHGPMPTGKLFGFVVRRRGDGYVIGPGSVHPSGVVYDTLRQANGRPYDIADLPEKWAEAATSKARLTVVGTAPLPEPGQRHDWLRDRARYYRGVMNDPAVLKAALMAENARLSHPKSEGEVDRAIGRVFELFPPDPPEEAEERAARRLGEDALGLLSAPTAGAFPAPPAAAAFDGLLGDCVRDLASGTDASEVGLLGSLIAFCGALIPGAAYFHRLQTSSPFVALVGESSIGRKGTAMVRAADAMSDAVGADHVNRVILDGLNSGEGLVAALDYKRTHFPYEPTVGLVFEEEYATLLASRGREGSTLDPKMRTAFDGSPISNRRSGETKTVNPPYWLPALIAITPTELRLRLEAGALQSGSANRWLYLPVVKRDGTADNSAPAFEDGRRAAILEARKAALNAKTPISIDPAVTRQLSEYSDWLPTVAIGVGRDLTRRLGIIAFRVALVHALVERSTVVAPGHLTRAIALTEYARAGIAWVFGETVGNRDADLLFRYLLDRGRLTKHDITQEITRDPLRRQAAIDELTRLGVAEVSTIHPEGRGRPRTELVAVGTGTEFRAFRARFANSVPENLHEMHEMHGNAVLSTNDLARNSHEIRTEIARKSETGEWLRPCNDYTAHQASHRQTAEGWICDACDRLEGKREGAL